jgi:hypothetical protein
MTQLILRKIDIANFAVYMLQVVTSVVPHGMEQRVTLRSS